MEVGIAIVIGPKLTHFRVEKHVHFKTLYNCWPPFAKQGQKLPKPRV